MAETNKMESLRVQACDGPDGDISKTFEAQITAFRSQKDGIISKLPCNSLHYPGVDENTYEMFADPSWLEYHMNISRSECLERFFSFVQVGDMVEGHIECKVPSALEGVVDKLVGSGRQRCVQNLDVKCILRITELHSHHSDQEVLYRDFQVGDVFKGVVRKVDKEEEILMVSLREDQLEESLQHVKLGYKEHKRPPSPLLPPRDIDFRNHLEADPGFHNPACTNNLISILGIECNNTKSLFSSAKNPPFPKEEYSDALRKDQLRKYSLEITASGVKHLKEERHKEAKKCFDQALDVDPENVEALVARGAQYANKKEFEEGLRDFEEALKHNSSHKNAKQYLAETHTALAKKMEREGSFTKAMKHYQNALEVNPDHQVAFDCKEKLRVALEKKVEEDKRKKHEQKLIKKALKKMMSENVSGRQKAKSSKKHKLKLSKKHKHKRRQQSDSDDSLSTCDETLSYEHKK